ILSYSGTDTTKPNFECSLDKSPYSNNAKHGSYKPMSWTIEVKLSLMSYDILNFFYRGTDLFFRKIAELIVQIFPKEQKCVYFIPSKTEGSHQTHAKGKLIERWKNVARRLRSVVAISYDRIKPLKYINVIPQSIHFSDEVLNVKKWLLSDGLN
ncbi:Uncharacterized protein FWK35_00035294, partial [Aphis craccivora]